MSVTSVNSYSPAAPPTSTAESAFIRYSLDGKEASLVNISHDNVNHLLWVTAKVVSPGITLDLLQLKVAVMHINRTACA